MKKILVLIASMLFLLPTFSGCVVKEDSDKDGLPDNIEKEGWNVTVFYPGSANSTTYHVYSDIHKKDGDGDGLTDYEEFSRQDGTTDPTKKDTDSDGLTDYEEVMIFHTNPLNWHDDIDGDNFPGWKGDYQEIEYYQKHGIDNKTIRKYLQNRDVDNDSIPDGYDKDPLRNLKIRINITGLRITSMLDGPNDDILEILINVSSEIDWHSFSIPSVIVGENESLNLSCMLDLDDRGMPGQLVNSMAITVVDLDEGMEKKPFDKDGMPNMDIVRIYRVANQYTGSYVTNDFNISKDCHNYHIKGPDGEMWFEIEDVSTGKS